MREVLASIPGFSLKPRRRTNKKMSTAAQIEQTREGCIDLETPDSILVSTNLRDLLNKETFCLLPPLYQYKLVQLLPSVDRPVIDNDTETIRLNSSSLTNEFFARACLEWRERLGEGEFTPENQLKLRTEAEKEKIKLDPWKLKHFEPIWGYKSNKSKLSHCIRNKSVSTSKTVINNKATITKNRPETMTENFAKKSTSVPTAARVDANNKTDLTLRSRITSNENRMPTGPPTDRLSFKTTINFNSIRESQRNTRDSVTASLTNNYTTSSGRIVRSPSNYIPTGTNTLQSQKRARLGAITRSIITTASTRDFNPNVSESMKIPSSEVRIHESRVSIEKFDPAIVPVTQSELKVCC